MNRLLHATARHVPIAVLLCLAACGERPPAPPSGSPPGDEQVVRGHERLGWAQRASTPEELKAYRYWVYVDDVRAPLQMTECSSVPSVDTHDCSAPLPPLTPGRHVLELTTSVEHGSNVQESARSSPLVIIMEGGPETRYQIGGELASDPAAIDVHYDQRPIVTGLAAPTAIAPLPDGRILIGERGGTVKIGGVEGAPPTIALQSADLQDFDGGEIVLQGLRLHPAFRHTAFVYVMYTELAPGHTPVTRVARFRCVGDRLGERAMLLDGLPARPVAPGGALGFGADGKLYVATDDGNQPAARSDPAALAGKLLRLEDDGSAASDNPSSTPVIFAGLHRPAVLEWGGGAAPVWVVDAMVPDQPADLWRQGLVSVRLADGVSSACIYRGKRLPFLDRKLVTAQGDSLGYIDTRGPQAGAVRAWLHPGLGRIQVVQADQYGFLYFATGNTARGDGEGRDVVIRLSGMRAAP